MSIDLELYRVFCEVVKYKNISKTAENMYISQSAVTQSIQKLERILGGKLFYRNKTGVELTEEGKNLYEYIKDSIETMSNAENIFSNYINLEKGKLRIAGGNSLMNSIIINPLMEFAKDYPNIDISISGGLTESLVRNLSNGELDLVALNLPFNATKYSNIEIIPIKESSYSFFGSKKYLKENAIKKFEDIEKAKLILPKSPSAKYRILEEYCQQQKIKLHADYQISSSSIVKKIVLNDLGIGFAKTESLEDIKNDIKIVKTIKLGDMQEGIATLKKNMCNKATVEFVKKIKEYYK